jgi:hypothetical protein
LPPSLLFRRCAPQSSFLGGHRCSFYGSSSLLPIQAFALSFNGTASIALLFSRCSCFGILGELPQQ